MVNMNGIGSSNIFQAYKMQQDKLKKPEKTEKADTEKAEDVTKEVNSKVTLSDKAQKVLDRIKEKYSDMDIFVADFKDNDEAQEIMSRGTKDYSLLISPDELEKMAEDEEYEKDRLNAIDGSLNMCKEINEKYGLDAALKEDGDSTFVSGFGITLNSDGTTSLFANLEQISAKQKEHIKAMREAKAEQAKEEKESKAEKAEEKRKAEELSKGLSKKSTTVTASTMEELMDKIQGVDWSKIESSIPESKFDFRG